MSWKKILFLCLSFVFVFGGVFGFYTEVKALSANGNFNYGEAAKGTGTAGFQNPTQIKEASTQAAEDAKKSWFDIFSPFKDALLFVITWIALWFLRLAALIAGLSGYLFDTIIGFTVIDMATNMDITNTNGFINMGWTVLRDVVNIMFIFVLLYIGIMTIVKGFASGTSKMIATVIVVALVINFSLFFTKIIIDSSNIISINFYNTLRENTDTGEANWEGIAAIFIQKAGLGTIYNTSKLTTESAGGAENLLIIAVGGIAMLTVLAIVIFIGSIMFITRYLALIIVLIASSAAIGSWILPSLKKNIYDKWWSALIGQSFFAPVFFLFLYITLLFVDKTVGKGLADPNGQGWVDLLTNTSTAPGGINLLLNYCLIVGSLIGTIVISKSLSNMAGSGAGKITSFVGGAALGVAGFAGRNTVGRLGNNVANSGFVSSLANSNSAFGRAVGGGLMRGGDKLAKSSMDLRNSGTFGKVAGDMMGKAGGAGGFAGQLEAQTKRRQEMLDRTSKLSNAEEIVRSGRNRQLSQNQRTLAAVNEDRDVIEDTRRMEDHDRRITQQRANLERSSRAGDAAGVARANAAIQVEEGARRIVAQRRDTRRNDIVLAESGGAHANLDDLEQDIRDITADNAAQTRDVTRRREQALTNFENSFISTLSTGLNRTRIATRLRNQSSNNVGGGAAGGTR